MRVLAGLGTMFAWLWVFANCIGYVCYADFLVAESMCERWILISLQVLNVLLDLYFILVTGRRWWLWWALHHVIIIILCVEFFCLDEGCFYLRVRRTDERHLVHKL